MRIVSASASVAVVLLLSTSAQAQGEFVGEWGARYHEDQPERIPGPSIGDFLGLPINDAARLRAESWDASIHTLPEWQCRPHPADYGTRGPANLRVWKEVDTATQRVIAYRTHVQWQAQERTIWMDGRAHPGEDAPHTWQGFSTGRWEGNTLRVVTTHLKEGYIRRNGVPRSDRATLLEFWTRHGNVLTLSSMVIDPVYLTEPFLRTTNWELTPQQVMEPYPCEVGEEVQRPEGEVPHHLPGANPFLTEFAVRNNLPQRAARGGAETAYPEFIRGGTGTTLPVGDVAPAAAPSPATPAPAGERPTAEIRVRRVRGGVFMLTTPRGNAVLQAGDEGALLVDTGPADLTPQVLAEVRKLSEKPIRYVINTHVHPDHVGGNQAVFAQGETIAGGDVANLVGDSSRTGAAIIAHENVLSRMSAAAATGAPLPFGAFPTDIYVGARKDLFFNDEAVRITRAPAAHTDGDSLVFFRRSDVVAAGDVYSTVGYPQIDESRGGSIQGVLDGLNQILQLTVPAAKAEGGTYVVPGHGRLSDVADVAYYRDMVTIIRDRIRDMKRRGLGLAQVKAARPTRDYDARWGADTGEWTTDRFVEAVYRTLADRP